MPATDRPNVLLIFTDQHRLSAVGCYGETPCRTPNIDRLASEGARFETAYTTCPVCSPARGTIMTGLYPHSHGTCSNVHNLGCSVHEIADRPELLSRRLQGRGYRCGYSGKWHLGTDQQRAFGGASTPSLPRSVGFEGQNFPGHGGGGFHYPEYRAYLAAHGWEHKVDRMRKDLRPPVKYGVLRGPVESTVPHFLAQHTIDMIDRFSGAGGPFFVWHNFWGPHGPYFATRECYDLYRDVEIPEWPSYGWPAATLNRPHRVKLHPGWDGLTWEDWAEAIRHYYAFTSLIDQQIGRVLDHLDATGLRDNTIVVLTADHGETLGSHGGLIDKGWHHFEEIQRIPLIVSFPERLRPAGLKPGAVIEDWASLADVYPTILEMAGAHCETGQVQGRSLMPLLRGEAVTWRDAVFVEFYGVNSLATSMVSVRRGNLKYGWNCSNLDELYDLEADPHEMKNLIDDPAYARAARELRGLMGEWMEQTGFGGLSMYRRSRLEMCDGREWNA